MTIVLRMVDGAPLTAQQERQAWGAVHGGGSGRQLGGRSGFRVGTPSNVLTASSTTWTLGACSAMLDPGAQTHQGMYGWSNDSNLTGAVTAADATYDRKDIVYIQVNDSDMDTSGAKSAPVLYLAGSATASPAAPALPPRSFLLGTITVPKAGGGSPTVLRNPATYVAAGGLQPIESNTERSTLTPYKGLAILRTDYNGIEIHDGTDWSGPLTATLVSPPDSGWSIGGGITRTTAQGFKQCRATLRITRVGSAAATINQTYNALLSGSIPATFRPAESVQGRAVMSTTGGDFRANLECLISTTGDIAFRVASGSVTLAANDVFYVDMGWWQ